MQAPAIPVVFFQLLPEHPKWSTRNMLSLLDQFFAYHPEPCQDRDWARLRGCRLRMFGFRLLMGRGRSVGTLRRSRIVLSYSGATAMPAESSIDWRICASTIGSDCPSSSSTITATGGVREGYQGHQRKVSPEGAFNSIFQL